MSERRITVSMLGVWTPAAQRCAAGSRSGSSGGSTGSMPSDCFGDGVDQDSAPDRANPHPSRLRGAGRSVARSPTRAAAEAQESDAEVLSWLIARIRTPEREGSLKRLGCVLSRPIADLEEPFPVALTQTFHAELFGAERRLGIELGTGSRSPLRWGQRPATR